ncbi:MAG: lipoyl synthase [Myxococcota bacterium]|nr:lipoyl synthase [Myxococcota bacterium]MEC8424354.1 lipoyl synthase [Myxococcota bacterium]
MGRTKPSWLKVKMPGGSRYNRIKSRKAHLKLHTVCEEARCPNIGECWGSGTATFMVMGGICTRGCRFCAVKTRRKGMDLDPDEPRNVAHAIAEMELDYVVLTSVDRDDLEDQGSGHFAACIEQIRLQAPQTMVEVLVPDFSGQEDLMRKVVVAAPDVLAHNVECVERLTPRVRDPRAGYQQSLDMLESIKRMSPAMHTKSSLMVGLGETEPEMIQAMRDMRAVGVDFLTIGQYLQPTKKHLKVEFFVEPQQFDRYEQLGLEMGFTYVASGPLVRSSYKAGEFFIQRHLKAQQLAAESNPLPGSIDLADIAQSLEIGS